MGDLGEVCVVESAAGGTDVCSSAGASPDHLVVMVHGILGSMDDWRFGAEQIAMTFPDKVIVHCSEKNMYRLTLDGVDIMGERLADEVLCVLNKRSEIRKISFVAHSVGGLVARYAIGKLYRPPERKTTGDSLDEINSDRGTICGLQAVNFITVATPHLGSRGNKQVPFLFGFTAIEKVASCVIHWIFGRTGKHLFLTDDDEGKPPLLQRMIDDCDGLYFMSALRVFRRRVAYANVGYDRIPFHSLVIWYTFLLSFALSNFILSLYFFLTTSIKDIVGWRTSSIRRHSELPKWEDSVNEKYPHVVYEELTKGNKSDKLAEVSDVDDDYDEVEERLVTGLTSVSWERIDVSFHTSHQRFAAHSVIQVKHPFMQSEGADVIQHMIDHFHI